MRELDGHQRRELIDCEQRFLLWREVARRNVARFAGSMSWKTVSGRRYLYRKTDGVWRSLGPASAETEHIYDRFHEGRQSGKDRLASLDQAIRKQAPILRAMELGRVPELTARILRHLDKLGVLGKGMSVVGTNALYAYERMAGIHFGRDLAATQDIDLLYDARGGLNLVSSGLAETGLVGSLHRVDTSFELTAPNSFRAANRDGFMVDLITPSTRTPATRTFRQRLGSDSDDLMAAEIDGLTWLESCPRVETVAIDERGFPLMLVAPDPRAFVCHKLWVAARDDRDPVKRRRDRAQADAVCLMLLKYRPDMRFDDPSLHALPNDVRAEGARRAETIGRNLAASKDAEDWP